MNPLPFRQIHLDFHTSERIPGIGRDFDGEEFASTLKEAGVDSVTCFAKCHHGMLYYDTRFEARHPYLERNLLAEQIECCHSVGIRAPIYISAGIDEFMARRHPEWLEIERDGKVRGAGPLQAGWRKLCLNSPYVDYLIDQTREVLDIWGDEVDGLFFDIVAQCECCCRYCLEDMLAGGYDPESQEDLRRFADRVTDEFKIRMSAAVREKNPGCSLFYNSGHVGPSVRRTLDCCTHLELESLPGGSWGYEHFPIAARYARNLGREFIGMTGKFHKSWGDFGGFKNPAALEYECFSALALGGGCSIGDQLHPTGRLTKATYRLVGDVYHRVAEKEPWCRGASACTEIGIVTHGVLSDSYPHERSDADCGARRMFGERHYQYDFVDFGMELAGYKVLVLPDDICLTDEQAALLNGYLAGGGRLLLSYRSGMGTDGYDFLLDDMPVRVKGESPYSPDFLAADEVVSEGIPESEHVMYERGLELEVLPGARSLAGVWKPYFERSYKNFCSHFHTPAECPAGYSGMACNANIVYAGYPIFGMYKRHGSRVYRDMVINALKLLLPDRERLVNTNAPTTADITLNYQPDEDRYILHVLHYIPELRYGSSETIEDVIPIYDVDVSILLPEEYRRVEMVPEKSAVEPQIVSGRLSFVIPRVTGHRMISITR